MPLGAPSFAEALRSGAEIFHALRGILKARGQSTGVGDEGGFAPNLKSNREALEVVLEAIGKAGLKAGSGRLDRARRRVQRTVGGGGRYAFKKSGEPDRTSDEMIRLYEDWIRQYPIVSIEDGLAESDWDGWERLTRALGGRVQLVGDDVFVTNPEILKKGHRRRRRQRAAREAESDRHRHRNTRRHAHGGDASYAAIISHRSGETEDTTIADLAVGTGAGQIKTGSASRTDRICKYNQLLRIEEELGAAAHFAGRKAIRTLAMTVTN